MRRHTHTHSHVYTLPYVYTDYVLYYASTIGHTPGVSVCVSFGLPIPVLSEAFDNACVSGHVRVVSVLLAAGTIVRDLNIYTACFYGRTAVVSALIAAGANVNSHDGGPIICASRSGYHDIVCMLIKAGAQIPPLAFINAVHGNHLCVVQELMSAGYNIHTNGENALRHAVTLERDAIADYLIAAGADVSVAIENCGYYEITTIAKLRSILKISTVMARARRILEQ